MTAAQLQIASRAIAQPFCPYCRQPALYGEGKWSCLPCKAWVKVYPGNPTLRPVGRLAKERLRGMHLKAYASVEHLWRTVASAKNWPEERAKRAANLWLAEQLGVRQGECRIAFFGELMTQQVIDICMAVSGKKDVAA
jgi:zinc-finger-containing domain